MAFEVLDECDRKRFLWFLENSSIVQYYVASRIDMYINENSEAIKAEMDRKNIEIPDYINLA